MTTTSVLRFWYGYPSAYTLGKPLTDPSSAVPQSISLLGAGAGFTVESIGGSSAWIPSIAAPKSGSWSDSQTFDGRTPVGLPIANAIEQLTLICPTHTTAYTALSDLNRYGAAARAFWEDTGTKEPVWVEWRAEGAPGSQYALIYNIEVALESIEALGTPEAVTIALTFEREPAWRGIAPGLPARVWTLEQRGLKPTTENPSPTGFYNWNDIAPSSSTKGGAAVTLSGSYLGDEVNTSNVNFIDIAADTVVGDAPALCHVILNEIALPSPPLTPTYFIRDTLATAATQNTNYAESRKRMKHNGGDAALSAVTNVTLSKQIKADGWLSNGSTVNRTVARAVFGAGVAGTGRGLIWQSLAEALRGDYALFITYSVNSGVGTDVTVNFNYSNQSLTGGSAPIGAFRIEGSSTTPVTRYVGAVSFPARREGVSTANETYYIWAGFTKTTGATPTIDIYDIWLAPLREAFLRVTPDTAARVCEVDCTGYYDVSATILARTFGGSQPIQAPEVAGQPLTLIPRKTNRIYVAQNGAFISGSNKQVTADIIPRWYGVRDV